MLPMSPARDGLENLLKKSFPTTCREVMDAAGMQMEDTRGKVNGSSSQALPGAIPGHL